MSDLGLENCLNSAEASLPGLYQGAGGLQHFQVSDEPSAALKMTVTVGVTAVDALEAGLGALLLV